MQFSPVYDYGAHGKRVSNEGVLSMKRYAYALALLGGLSSAPAYAVEVTPQQPTTRPQRATTNWIAFAASQDGRVFRHSGGTESSSKTSAQAECEQKTLRSCNAISVQTETDVVVVNCGLGRERESFLGGSNINMGGARWLAMDKAKKAGYDENACREIFTY